MKGAKKFEWIGHLLLWTGLYLVWVFIFQSRTLTFSRTLGIQFCYLVFIAFNFYLISYFIIPGLLNQARYMLFVAGCVALLIFSAWIRAEVVLFINSTFYNIPSSTINFTSLYFASLLNIFFWTVCLVACKLVVNKIQADRHMESAMREKILTELNFLRAQNNPHFLFNTLNSIYFQIDKNNKNARETLMRLSEMLRYQLYECSVEKISIEREIEYLENYIELEKLRLDKNYNIQFLAGKNLNNFSVAPLLFLPLVENAFKHVSHFTEECNQIRINLDRNEQLLECLVFNSVEKTTIETPTINGGIGLKNLRRRLELLYPGIHELSIDKDEYSHSIKLSLVIHEN